MDSYCVSFGFPLCVHPSRCCDVHPSSCFDVHPSRCLVMCILRDALLCDVLGVFAPEVCRVVLSWGSWRKTSPPPSLRFFLPKDLFGCNLLLPGATLVRVVFKKKTSSPFLTSHCPEVFCEEEVFVISIYDLFANEAMCRNYVFCEKMSPPLLRAVVLEGLSSFCFG